MKTIKQNTDTKWYEVAYTRQINLKWRLQKAVECMANPGMRGRHTRPYTRSTVRQSDIVKNTWYK